MDFGRVVVGGGWVRAARLVAGAVIGCAIGGGSAAAAAYTILDLGAGRTEGFNTVNANGQVAVSNGGAFRTGPNHAIVAGDYLGSLGWGSSTNGLNASGQVVGWVAVDANGTRHPYRTTAGGTITPASDLGTLGGARGEAFGINDAGQAVGYADTTPDPIFGFSKQHAFRTAANAAINAATDDLGTLGGDDSFAFNINARGQVVGVSATPTASGGHAFRTAANAAINPATDDLGTLGGTESTAFAINASGQVAGWSYLAGDKIRHAFRTAPGGTIATESDLGVLGGPSSQAKAMNSAGQTVGYSTIDGSFDLHAFVCDVTGPMRDLNDLIPAGSGWVLSEANGINDLGQIAAFGTRGGATHAFLLTPTPEPSLLTPVGVGLIVAIGGRRFRRSA